MPYKQPPKYRNADGSTVETKHVRLPAYLVQEIEAYARRLHEERMGKK